MDMGVHLLEIRQGKFPKVLLAYHGAGGNRFYRYRHASRLYIRINKVLTDWVETLNRGMHQFGVGVEFLYENLGSPQRRRGGKWRADDRDDKDLVPDGVHAPLHGLQVNREPAVFFRLYRP